MTAPTGVPAEDAQTADTPDPRRWRGMAILSLSLLMVGLDTTILNVALPALIEDMRPSAVGQLWIVNAYALVITGLLVTMGALGDRTGRRRLLLAGLAVFGAASLLAVTATDPATLIAARALLGLGGAMIMPSTLSILRNLFDDPRERTRAITLWAAVAGAGAAAGPIVGGYLVEHFGWRSAFWVNVPIVLFALVASRRLLPESSSPSTSRWDWWSVLLSFAGMAALVQGVKMLAKHGPLAADSGGMLVLSALLLTLFVRRQLRLEDPLLDVTLFRSRSFSLGAFAIVLSLMGMGSVVFLFTQSLQLVRGHTADVAGLWTLPGMLAMFAMSLLTYPLLHRFATRTLIAASLLVLSLGVLFPAISPSELVASLSLILVGAGASTAFTAGSTLLMAAAPADRAGGVGAIEETGFELGNVLGVAALGSLAGVFYRANVAVPSGVPSADATVARDSIGEAVTAAEHLPHEVGAALATSAKSAFENAWDSVGLITAVGIALCAVAVLVFVPPTRNAAVAH